MKDKLTTENHRDFHQRYRGTYGKYTTKDGKTILVRLTEVDSEQVTFTDARGGVYTAHANSDIEFEFFSVERMLFNTPEGVGYCCRKPARMWSRGVSSQNTSFMNLAKLSPGQVNFKLLEVMLNPEYKKYYEDYKDGKIDNVALSKRFAIVNNKLMMFDVTIGEVNKMEVKVDTLYQQEFSDFIKRNALEFKVI